MIKRILHIESESTLRSKNRQLHIQKYHTENLPTAIIPFEDVGVIIIANPSVMISSGVYEACSYYGIAMVHCGSDHMPCALSLPIENHTRTSYYLREQLNVSLPNRKRLWKMIIREKILGQSAVLEAYGIEDPGLRNLADSVRSGDVENIEGVAAARYFQALFHGNFVRERGEGTRGPNAWLNYGYAVVRAAVARSIVGAGLHPSVGIWHENGYNYFNLADDLVEPFRPLVDSVVKGMTDVSLGTMNLTTDMKTALVGILTNELIFNGIKFNMTHLLDLYATSFRKGMVDSGEFIIPEVSRFIQESGPVRFKYSELWE